jgi:glycosyltransferase involved in cell wall biosynthesis
MKIAFVNQPWAMVKPPVQSGSLSIWTWEVARRLAKEHRVVVFEGCKTRPVPDTLICEGVEYRFLYVGADELAQGIRERFERRGWASNAPASTGYYYLSYAVQLAMQIRREKFDVVQIHQCSQFAPIIRALNPDVKIVMHMNAEWLTQFDPRLIEPRFKSIDLILGCSEHISGLIRKRFPQVTHKCGTVPNGTDCDKFTPPQDDRRFLPQRAGSKRLIFVGRVSPEKGVHDLLEAFAAVVQQVPDVEMHIVGPVWSIPANFLVDLSDDPVVLQLRDYYVGTYQSHLDQRITPSTRDKIRFVGAVPNDNLPEIYRAADLLINPSLSESFGITVTEAMASGTPVIGTLIGGMKETIVDGVTGHLVPPANPRALADAIVKIVRSSETSKAMGDAGRRRVVEMYDWTIVVERLLKYYGALLSRHTAPAKAA